MNRLTANDVQSQQKPLNPNISQTLPAIYKKDAIPKTRAFKFTRTHST